MCSFHMGKVCFIHYLDSFKHASSTGKTLERGFLALDPLIS